jgi:hypothetical protein
MSYCVKPTRPAFWKPQTLQLDRTDRQLTAQGSFLFHRYEKTTSAFLELTTRNCKQKTNVYERSISWFRLYSKYRRFKHHESTVWRDADIITYSTQQYATFHSSEWLVTRIVIPPHWTMCSAFVLRFMPLATAFTCLDTVLVMHKYLLSVDLHF